MKTITIIPTILHIKITFHRIVNCRNNYIKNLIQLSNEKTKKKKKGKEIERQRIKLI